MSGPPRILAFDTSGPYCSAALLIGDSIVASRHEEMGKGQAERLFPMLDEVLDEAGTGWRDLDAVGVGTGPGNFTGIRIAVSAARGLALSLGVPAIGISLFDALSFGSDGDVLLTLAAPRGQFYVQTRIGGEVSEIALAGIDALPVCPEGTVCVGHQSREVAEALGLEHRSAATATAPAIARVAAARAHLPHDRPSPLYIRAADALPASDPPPVILP